MFKINLSTQTVKPKIIYSFYDDINRIPLEIIFKPDLIYTESIWRDNLKNGSFIEFRFCKLTGEVVSLTIVSLENFIETLFLEDLIFANREHPITMFLHATELKEEKRRSYEQIRILKIDTQLLLLFGKTILKELLFYNLDEEKLSVGVLNNEVKAILIDCKTYDNFNSIF
jgi:hypothetical protein